MKIRFYRGPMDGKVKHYSFHPNQPLEIVATSLRSNWAVSGDANKPFSDLPMNRHIYRAVKMNDGLGGVAYAMHPDGSYFFEWDQPRRVRGGN